MIGQVDGSRRQGRPRLRWIDSIKENTGFGVEKLRVIVKDRNKWCRLVEEKTRNRERTNINPQAAGLNFSCHLTLSVRTEYIYSAASQATSPAPFKYLFNKYPY
jgi:hypothetical protein